MADSIRKRRAHKGLRVDRRMGATVHGQAAIVVSLGLIGLAMLLPFVNEIAKSLSHPEFVNRGLVSFWPQGFTLRNYQHFFDSEYRGLWRAFFNSIYITSIGTVWSVFFTACMAYPMSKTHKAFRAGPALSLLIVFAIVFFPPMIPYFLAVRGYGLMNTRWVIILAHTIGPFYLIIVRTFFRGLPQDLFDAADIDGASDIRQALQLAFPLAKPALATIGIYTAVLLWNVYLHSLLFIRDASLMPLQPVVRSLMASSGDTGEVTLVYDAFRNAESTKSALLIISIIPIALVYPLLQKHFTKGALLGSVKS
ncbi:MAG: carbohydrate ABC transporter permease [Spirochaetota bacterium]